MSAILVGLGYDAHRLEDGRPLILGGVNIPHSHGLLAHSDGDVLCHAIIDALLGACCLGDIGVMFPDSSDDYKGISSLILLKQANQAILEKRCRIINIDSVIIAQSPKLSPYISEMRTRLAETLSIEPSQISVKATTEEGMGFTGQKQGISAQAICLLERSD